MTAFKKQAVNLLISHSQIALYDQTTYTDHQDKDKCRWEWGSLNIEQGAVLHPDCLTFYPLIDMTCVDNPVYLSVADNFVLDKLVKRAIVSPININHPDTIEVGSTFTQFKVDIDLKPGLFNVYFEICGDFCTNDILTDDEGGKLFFKFTLIKQPNKSKIIRPHYLLDDPWGGKKDKELIIGKADKPFTMKLAWMQKYLRLLDFSISKSSQIFTNLSEEERSEVKRSIGWHPRGGCLCIAHDFEPGEGWSVFYAERGSRYDIQLLDNESDACYAFIYRYF